MEIHELNTRALQDGDYMAIDNGTDTAKANVKQVLNGLLQPIETAVDNKVDKVTGKGLSTNDFTTAEKNKLAGIEAQATKTVVDSALSSTSTNAVQNKVITEEITDLKADLPLKADAIVSTASGSIAHFEDGAEAPVKDLKVAIEPVQDLHGYDSPWPAGGGKNLLDVTEYSGKSASINYTVNGDGSALTLTSNNVSYAYAAVSFNISHLIGKTFYINGTKTSTSSNLGYLQIRYIQGGSTRYVEIGTEINPTTAKSIPADSTTATFYIMIKNNTGDGSVGDYVTYSNLIVSTESNPSFAPYSNICPITGHNSVTVTRTGKNLWPFENEYSEVTGKTLIQNQPFPFGKLKAGTYTLSFYGSLSNVMAFSFRDNNNANVTVIEMKAAHLVNGRYIRTITIGECTKLNVYSNAAYNISDIQIEEGTTATDYEPYQSDTYDITIPTSAGTVYGGTLDVSKGELVVTHKILTPRTWNTDNGRFWASAGGCAQADINHAKAWCNCLPLLYEGGTAGTDAVGFTVAGNQRIYAANKPTITTLNEWNDFISQSNAMFVLPLVSPIAYTFTPQDITTLYGTNNIWADTGDTEVEYRADTKLFIEQLTKPTEDDMVANTTIQSGKYFMVNNRLFKSTAVIASGDTINPGTNCTEMSLADALNNL